MQPVDGLEPAARRRAMLVIILGIMVAVIDGTIVNLALPGIARELQASPSHAIWVVNAYQIATLVMLLPLASLGDLVGYRRVYLVGMAVFAVSSLGATFADSLGTLIVARTFQGLGAAGIMSVNAALVRLTFPSALLGRGMAINSMVVATSSVAGPSVAAAILSVASWPWLFAINVPLGLLVFTLGMKALPFNRVPPAAGLRFSPLDVALNVLMFSLVFLGVDRLGVREGGAPSPWASSTSGGSAAWRCRSFRSTCCAFRCSHCRWALRWLRSARRCWPISRCLSCCSRCMGAATSRPVCSLPRGRWPSWPWRPSRDG
jgi:DHA2 family multidrug resistance protein-like MFS transporter